MVVHMILGVINPAGVNPTVQVSASDLLESFLWLILRAWDAAVTRLTTRITCFAHKVEYTPIVLP